MRLKPHQSIELFYQNTPESKQKLQMNLNIFTHSIDAAIGQSSWIVRQGHQKLAAKTWARLGRFAAGGEHRCTYFGTMQPTAAVVRCAASRCASARQTHAQAQASPLLASTRANQRKDGHNDSDQKDGAQYAKRYGQL